MLGAWAWTSASSSEMSMRCPSPLFPRAMIAASAEVQTSSEVITSISGTVTRTGSSCGWPFIASRPA
jgi:hypothetical protein